MKCQVWWYGKGGSIRFPEQRLKNTVKALRDRANLEWGEDNWQWDDADIVHNRLDQRFKVFVTENP